MFCAVRNRKQQRQHKHARGHQKTSPRNEIACAEIRRDEEGEKISGSSQRDDVSLIPDGNVLGETDLGVDAPGVVAELVWAVKIGSLETVGRNPPA